MIPAALQALAKACVQICSGVQKPSLMTVDSTFVLVTATGVRITDGTLVVPLFVFRLMRFAGSGSPFASGTASRAASYGIQRILAGEIVRWARTVG